MRKVGKEKEMMNRNKKFQLKKIVTVNHDDNTMCPYLLDNTVVREEEYRERAKIPCVWLRF